VKSDPLVRGIELLKSGRYSEAVRTLEESVRKGGGDKARFLLSEARRILGADPVLTRPGGRPFGASGSVKAAQASVRLRSNLAFGRSAEAFGEAEKLLSEDPSAAFRALRDLWLDPPIKELPDGPQGSPWTEFLASSLAWKRGDAREALRRLRRVDAGSKRYGWMRYFAAEVLMRHVELYASALVEIGSAAETSPWLWEARCLEAELAWSQGNKDFLKKVEKMKVPGSGRAAFLAWRGALKLWSGRYRAALKDLDIAVQRDNPDAFCWRGGARVRLGRLEAAIEDLTMVLRIDPVDPEALVWRAEAYRRAGRVDESLHDLDTLLSRSVGTIPWAHANRCLIRLERKDLTGAQEDFSRMGPPRAVSDSGEMLYPPAAIPAKRLRKLLGDLFEAGLGCRRSDRHLNEGWMRAAGIEFPDWNVRTAGFLFWMRGVGVPIPSEARLKRLVVIVDPWVSRTGPALGNNPPED